MDVLAGKIASCLYGGEVLCLYGDLGAGKTTFTQFLARKLGVKENVTSPTFVLLKKYGVKCQMSNVKYLYHLDAYRLGSSAEALDLGLEEIWLDPKNITVIEWADRISDVLPEERVDIVFSLVKDEERKVIVKNQMTKI